MITPLRDLFYTVCYYQVQDFTNINNSCQDNSSFTILMLPLVIAISYKILQSIRKGIDEGKYFMTIHMGATIKYLFSLSTAFISFVYNQGA
jgi:EXS family